jgi:hypothetical protein
MDSKLLVRSDSYGYKRDFILEQGYELTENTSERELDAKYNEARISYENQKLIDTHNYLKEVEKQELQSDLANIESVKQGQKQEVRDNIMTAVKLTAAVGLTAVTGGVTGSAFGLAGLTSLRNLGESVGQVLGKQLFGIDIKRLYQSTKQLRINNALNEKFLQENKIANQDVTLNAEVKEETEVEKYTRLAREGKLGDEHFKKVKDKGKK